MQSNKSYYIGIDGGGTKTEGLLCDCDGVILVKSTAGSTNLKSREEEDVRAAIHHVMKELIDGVHGRLIAGIFVSTAGGDREEDQQRWKKWITQVFPDFGGVMMVRNDAYGALASGTFSMEGTVLIAGTGSIAYSINDESKRVGGWGYLFGDEGSGYDIGRQALRKVAMMHDGREEGDEVFSNEVLAFLNLKSSPEIITAIYEDPYARMKIASLARIVLVLAERKNRTAELIVKSAIDHLIGLVKAIEVGNGKLVICGGLFQSIFFRRSFIKRMVEKNVISEVNYPTLSPAAGACICALITGGISITVQLKENLMSSHHAIDG
ncbi:BadF/BadG/BcrA/BcrD ATPase family protein [Pseudalkalibacillus hwajinpoensis]|uniref:N-acetylglucosamine kinase n=1 Tax=Guptibacillus hwajinpoensis TaxID=208199 RepID=UPI00325C1057